MLLRTLLLSTSFGITAACTSAGAGQPRPVSSGTQFTLAVGEQVALPDSGTLRYVGVRDDSRCRPGTQCIRAGEARVDFEYTTDAGSQRLTLVQPDAPTARLGAWTLTIEALEFETPPRATLRLTAE